MVPAWSPDGTWIYFVSNRSGHDEAWRMPSGGGAATRLTHAGAREVLPSPDGTLAYFIKWDRGGIFSIPVNGGQDRMVPGLEHANKSRSWGVLKQGIYFISHDPGERYSVRFYSFASGQVTPLVDLDGEPFWNAPVLSLSPDGRSLLYARLDHDVNDIMLIDGFQ
jgi:Tol biopolymer transport system component